MSNSSRVITTDGKSTSGGAKRFGMTLKDRTDTTNPNMTQLTLIPASGTTIQKHQFIIGTSTGALLAAATTTVTPDLTLDATRFYQFSAYLTLVVQSPNNTFINAHYLLTSAVKGNTSLIGNNGFRLDQICAEDTFETFITDMGITLGISGNNFVISVTNAGAIATSLDIMADINITSGVFSP